MESHFPAQILLWADFTEKLKKLGDLCKSIKKVIEPDKTVIHIGFPLKVVAHSMNQSQIRYLAHSK